MSRYRSKPVKFTCTCDCQQSGCPGHVLQIEYCCSSDTATVLVDGEIHTVFDDAKLAALVEAYNSATD